jgi:DNA polymerase III subunit epsilon
VCPERAVPADAVALHGLTAEFPDKPLFADVADELLAFVGDAPLVAHNAGFDIAFLNAELKAAAKPPIASERVIDTLVLARRTHAGGLALDDLCSRYGVDRSHRTQHGALLDAELLAAVYVELTTTRQAALQLDPIRLEPANIRPIIRVRPDPLPPRVTAGPLRRPGSTSPFESVRSINKQHYFVTYRLYFRNIGILAPSPPSAGEVL